MKRMVAKKRYFLFVIVLAVTALCLRGFKPLAVHAAKAPAQAQPCPTLLGWQEGLSQYLQPDAPFPTQDTKNNPQDCNFHQWSWEAFVWATALDGKGVPRFMGLPNNNDLLSKSENAREIHVRQLKLAARGAGEGAGAFVQADHNVLVAHNGYPVYGSIHMNQLYFDTARKNLIKTGGYTSQDPQSSFPEGSAVFKATWLRLDPGQQPPAGAYTTDAQVPDLMYSKTQPNTIVTTGKFRTVKVALVGLHVVGYTVNHPEFLWGTFEHRLNTPAVADGTFSKSGSSPKSYTFYTANTSFANVNQAAVPPALTLDAATQKLSPVTNAVLENQTGGENQPGGPGNIQVLNTSGQSFLTGLNNSESIFANYNLIGTVWMAPSPGKGSYNIKSTSADAVGSIYLANTTAETFAQQSSTELTPPPPNCFSCHNATSYRFAWSKSTCPPALPDRKIALSHVLAEGTKYAIANQVPAPAVQSTPCPSVKAEQ